jgi:hypothetical protein
MAPMPVVAAAVAMVVGVHVVPELLVVPQVAIVTGPVTEFAGNVQVESGAQTPSCPWLTRLEMTFPLPLADSVQGLIDVHFVVPVESVNGVAKAVRVQPPPEPVASMMEIYPLRSTTVSYPERVSDHLIVGGAATAREPAVTVAVPVIEQSRFGELIPLAEHFVVAPAFDVTMTAGPIASTPATNASA